MANLIILDSGHAEKVLGKEAPDKSLREWDFNNQMQYKIQKRCEEHGIEVYLTNPKPYGIGEMGLTKRTDLANSYWENKNKPKTLFISIHANAHLAEFTSARGTEVYHADNASQNSKNAANYTLDEIVSAIRLIDSKALNRGVKSRNFTVIYKTAMPSILIEYAFYTNKDDLVILKNNKDELVEATIKGICKYFSIDYKPITVKQPINHEIYYRVIVGSYINKDEANKEVAKLREYGIEGFLVVFKKDGNTYYRVVASSFSSKLDAESLKEKLKSKGQDSFIVTFEKL